MKKSKMKILLYALLILIIGVSYYVLLPPINIQSPGFRMYLVAIVLSVLFIEIFADSIFAPQALRKLNKKYYLLGVVLLFIGFSFILQFFNGPVFRAKDYSALIEVEEKNFDTEFPTLSTDQIPMLDRDTAKRLGDRRIGSLTDLVSQFVPAETYTQINIANEPYRVTPLEYAGFMQWLNNRNEGLPNYLAVDMVTGEVAVEDVEDGIKYSHAELFNRNVHRYLRFKYPTKMFQNPSFEVDDDGHPHYIATTYENRFLFTQQEPSGVIVLDAVTGDTAAYTMDDMPNWVDRIYSAELIIQQLNYRGLYTNGFWNSVFQKRGVTETTNGYNYIPMYDDVYLYTGVTSINRDASNIGFYLVNLRTKDATFYPVTSADEFSAMESAEGSLQQMRFNSTFPLLISLEDKPYYISSLKDDSGLVRSYALVDAVDYQKVITAETVEVLISQVTGETVEDSIIEDVETDEEVTELTGQIEDIAEVVVDGNTVYYFMIDGAIYKADISLSDQLPFVNIGSNIKGAVTAELEFRAFQLVDALTEDRDTSNENEINENDVEEKTRETLDDESTTTE
ncbi:hypothetical protein GCM10012290_24370 [Halolactibacillus alkaliphilus]|uniref:Cell shape-determining protein n=1 Tax=Halolactibacillus alkaliphilus TaxID=442899 RepID=A0A511WZA2_9BACI|nr:hypothetical protein [Halolactibacillus alkaliphilus]GEN55952.1 hypothetical protein HAL01_04160 [Halolactibacillus alkaliphilus]GGN75475.1 hypothetical protein GCM10012290_24370 [Halolactibacillus alkaliphilus]SFO68942.1 hypothetical protein SAMN05720591_1051 [Halolactibacillus alkaliphilus]